MVFTLKKALHQKSSFSPPESFGHMSCLLTIFGRTDLRIGLSEAKFDAEAHFEVLSAVAPQKADQVDQKLIFRSKTLAEKQILAPKNQMLEIV